MEIRIAGDSVLHGTAQGILLLVVRGTDDILRIVKWPAVLVPGLKRNIFSSSTAAKIGVKMIIEKNGSSLDLGPFSVQLTRLVNMDPLDLRIVKGNRRTESTLCAISGKSFRRDSVLQSSPL